MSPTLSELGIFVSHGVNSGGMEPLAGDLENIVLTEEGARQLNKDYICTNFVVGQAVRLPRQTNSPDLHGNEWTPAIVIVNPGKNDTEQERIAVEIDNDDLFTRSSG